MVRGAAGDDIDMGDVPGVPFRQADVVQHHPALPDAGRDGLAHGLRLFQDLLEHEVGISPLLGGGRVPVDVAALLLQGLQIVVEHVHALGGQHGDLPVVHIGHVPGMPDDGRGVGGDEVLPLAEADDQRAVLPGGDEGVGIVRADDAEGVGAFNAPQAPAHGLQHVAALVVMELQQVGHHLAVGLGREGHALAGELFLELQVILDDAVVDQGDLAVPADVGMGIHVVGLAVRGPAGVPDAKHPFQVRPVPGQVRQDLEAALGLSDLEALRLRPHGDPRRVIAPVLHLPEPLQ